MRLLNHYRAGAFNVAVRELLNYYVAMEEFVMEEDVQKAIAIREHPPGNLTTSMVGDHRACCAAMKQFSQGLNVVAVCCSVRTPANARCCL